MTIKPTTNMQTNNWPTILFETEYFPFEKQNSKKICIRKFDIPY